MDKQLIEIIAKLCKVFDNDYNKVLAWLMVPNLNLGGSIAMNLIKANRGHKVLQFIDDAESGNVP